MTCPLKMPKIKLLTTEKNNPYASANATVNIIPKKDIEVKYGDDVGVRYVEDDIAVVEPSPQFKTREITPENEVNVYKLLLDAYIRNPIKVNDYVIMDGEELCALVKELTGSKNVVIEAEVDIACCGKTTRFNTIKNIICITHDDVRLDFEIEFNKDYRLLEDYRISTHLTYDRD